MKLKKLQKTAEINPDDKLPFQVLNGNEANEFYDLKMYEPDSQLSGLVDMYWVMHWDMAPGESFEAKIIPSAYTNLTCMSEGARVTGVTTGQYQYSVEGKGVIFGIMFKPGGLHSFFDLSISVLTDTFVPAMDIFSEIDEDFNNQIMLCSDEVGLQQIESILMSVGPKHDPNIDLISKIIDHAKKEPTLMISDISKQFAMSERKLQTLFEQYVGVGLKWIILRDRLQKATVIANEKIRPNWTEVANDLGYTDQSHFSNDFKRIIGASPSKYLKQNLKK